ncbi:MAG TPA: sigma-70 family RNA polymerase sigma factor [Polyangiaceae bacterium]|nr:sigma-70 family RNA polymerase sigma factor [Polyangiaceae bacterium]
MTPDLVRRIADPDLPAADRTAAERDLCLQLAPRIRLYALRRLRDEAASADLVQEALISLLHNARAGKIEDVEHVERYALGTCRNLVLRLHRRERHARSFEESAIPLAEHALPPAFARLDATKLAMCLGKLALREQKVVLLTFQEDHSAQEIASTLNTSPENVRVLRHRALAALQRCVTGGHE